MVETLEGLDLKFESFFELDVQNATRQWQTPAVSQRANILKAHLKLAALQSS